jgi:hypothetical protein
MLESFLLLSLLCVMGFADLKFYSFHRKSVGGWWWFNHHRSRYFAPVSAVTWRFELFGLDFIAWYAFAIMPA